MRTTNDKEKMEALGLLSLAKQFDTPMVPLCGRSVY